MKKNIFFKVKYITIMRKRPILEEHRHHNGKPSVATTETLWGFYDCDSYY